jgi:hypothetical protein
MACFSSVKPLSAAQLWDLLASNRVVVWGQRRSELEKQCLLTTRVRLDCYLDLVWGQDWFWSNLNFKRVSSVSVLSVSGVVFSLKRRIALSFTGESCMGLSPLFLRMSFISGQYRIYRWESPFLLGKIIIPICTDNKITKKSIRLQQSINLTITKDLTSQEIASFVCARTLVPHKLEAYFTVNASVVYFYLRFTENQSPHTCQTRVIFERHGLLPSLLMFFSLGLSLIFTQSRWQLIKLIDINFAIVGLRSEKNDTIKIMLEAKPVVPYLKIWCSGNHWVLLHNLQSSDAFSVFKYHIYHWNWKMCDWRFWSLTEFVSDLNRCAFIKNLRPWNKKAFNSFRNNEIII